MLQMIRETLRHDNSAFVDNYRVRRVHHLKSHADISRDDISNVLQMMVPYELSVSFVIPIQPNHNNLDLDLGFNCGMGMMTPNSKFIVVAKARG